MDLSTLEQIWTNHGWIISAIIAFTIGLWLHRTWSNYQRRARGLRSKLGGEKAEKKARKLLVKAGYEIVETQPAFEAFLEVDGEDRAFDITPDYLVYKDEIYYVVEVKRTDGDAIARASHRRQVTEYLLATGLPCLLVNMTLDEVQHIAFSEASDPVA